MHNLSMTQALAIWSELEQAYHGCNKFGGHVAEIYIYRAMPSIPALGMMRRAAEPGLRAQYNDAVDSANESLHRLFVHFLTVRNAEIEIDGAPLPLPPDKFAGFDHRAHVTVKPEKRTR